MGSTTVTRLFFFIRTMVKKSMVMILPTTIPTSEVHIYTSKTNIARANYKTIVAGHDSSHKQRLIEFVERVEEDGGVVAYKCGICHKTSARRDALTSHIENIHFPGAYKCYYCDLVFNSQNTRNVHIGRKHKFNTNIFPNSIMGSTI